MQNRVAAVLSALLGLVLLVGCGPGDSADDVAVGVVPAPVPTGPEILALVPARGSTLGGVPIQIQGRGFDAGTIDLLTLGGVALEDVVVRSTFLIQAVTPANPPGDASLVLRQGANTLRLDDAFTFEPPPPPPALYLADGRGGKAGALYRIGLESLTLEVVGVLPVALTGLAMGPDGALWGVEATRRGALGDSRLVRIDPQPDEETGELTIRFVGVLRDIERDFVHQSISDITFVGARLLGWTQDGDVPCEIDTATGTVSPLEGMVVTFGGGLAFNGGRTAWLAPQGTSGALHAYDTTDETVVVGPTLSGASIEGSAVGAMTYVQGALIALELSGQGNPERTAALISINPVTGVITPLSELPNTVAAVARGDL